MSDGRIMHEPISNLSKQIFEQAFLMREAQRISLYLGREQMARDVMAWAARHADALKGEPAESLTELCNKELHRD